ncbi:hypothetical protein ACFVTY_09370 [Streptomyces sp. NPDC058067]|uniref:hypothetical protein n=1 Tax=Streptomyces sp. NPDC058067 TaxID=3346324 RepID=UPI0036E06837
MQLVDLTGGSVTILLTRSSASPSVRWSLSAQGGLHTELLGDQVSAGALGRVMEGSLRRLHPSVVA